MLDLSGNNELNSHESSVRRRQTAGGADIDATAPTATVAATGHTYDRVPVITIIGTNLNTMGVSEDTGIVYRVMPQLLLMCEINMGYRRAGTSLMVLSDADVDTVMLKDRQREITLAGSADNVGRTKLRLMDLVGQLQLRERRRPRRCGERCGWKRLIWFGQSSCKCSSSFGR